MESLDPRALKGLRSLGKLRLEGGVGVASGGRLLGGGGGGVTGGGAGPAGAAVEFPDS